MRPRRLLGAAVVLALLGVVAPASAVVSPATRVQPSPQCASTHRVLPNDSWSRLAARFKVPQARLLRLNSASLTTPLFVGETVCLAVRNTSSSSGVSTTTTTTTSTTTTTVPTSTTTTTTTTTTTISVSLPVAPVLTVGALESCGRVSVSWSGASPDTGWYSVQWVPVSSGSYSFNSYTMFNARGSSSVLPNWFAAGSTYAIRVFAMRADWDGFWHRTENVTPHSAIVTFTVPSCIPATTTTVALTCATGGTCAVGDTGPGGGIVFYVHDDADDLFTSTGSDCGVSCRYLEAATGDQSAGVTWATTATACYDDASASSNNNCRLNSVYSGNTAAQTASRTGSNAIGKGMENTNQVYARLTTVGVVATSAYAAGIAWTYSNNGKADWHLPSKDELNQLYQRRDTVGGFSSNYWWSSSENDLAGAWYQYFFNGNQFADTKEYDLRVRPVRAFG